MATDAKNIHIGAGRIWFEFPLPATGDPPDLLDIDPDGTPTGATEVGFTQGASTFTYKATKQEVQAEQSLNPVDVFVTTEEATLSFTAMEHVYMALKVAFDSIGSVDDVDKTLFYGGDSMGLVSVNTQPVALTSRIRTAPDKFEVLCIYRVYNVEGIQIAYQRTTEAIYKVTMKALVDGDRDPGDRLFQWYRQKKSTVAATGATAGTPGSFTPSGAGAPANLAAMTGVTASPTTAWATGQYVVLGDVSHAHWTGSAWAAGNAP